MALEKLLGRKQKVVLPAPEVAENRVDCREKIWDPRERAVR